MNKIFYVIGVIAIVAVGIQFLNSSKSWSLFYYPNGCLGCVEDWIIQIDTFESSGECGDFGRTLQSRNIGKGDIFECGYKCKPYDETGYLCQETLDFDEPGYLQ